MKQGKRPIAAQATLMIAAIAIAQYTLPSKFYIEMLYLLPLGLVSWGLGRYWALLLVFLTAMGSAFLYEMQPDRHHIEPIFFYANIIGLNLIYIFAAFGLSKLKKVLEREQSYARTDFLTGITNRKSFFELASREIVRSRRSSRPLALAYIDCDNFKHVNDEYGHKVGDQLLIDVANVLSENLRTIDIVARIGGDEFVLLLPDTSSDQAMLAMRRLQRRIRKALDQGQWPVTISMGLAVFEHPPFSVEDLIKEADTLMYKSKRAGKDTLSHRIFRKSSEKNSRVSSKKPNRKRRRYLKQAG